jgi:hypothetical protein
MNFSHVVKSFEDSPESISWRRPGIASSLHNLGRIEVSSKLLKKSSKVRREGRVTILFWGVLKRLVPEAEVEVYE